MLVTNNTVVASVSRGETRVETYVSAEVSS